MESSQLHALVGPRRTKLPNNWRKAGRPRLCTARQACYSSVCCSLGHAAIDSSRSRDGVRRGASSLVESDLPKGPKTAEPDSSMLCTNDMDAEVTRLSPKRYACTHVRPSHSGDSVCFLGSYLESASSTYFVSCPFSAIRFPCESSAQRHKSASK